MESKWLYNLERKFRRFSISNLMIYISATMLAVYALGSVLWVSRGIDLEAYMILDRERLLAGELWRLVTFIFVPPNQRPVFVIIALYFYYFVGSSLENAWGAFNFTVYYLLGCIGVAIAAMISGYSDNTYLNLSLFFAFAALFPDYEIRLFFFLPIKVKYLAYVNWAMFALGFLFGSWWTRAAILMSLLGFFIFFGPGTIKKFRENFKYRKRRQEYKKNMRGGNPYGF